MFTSLEWPRMLGTVGFLFGTSDSCYSRSPDHFGALPPPPPPLLLSRLPPSPPCGALRLPPLSFCRRGPASSRSFLLFWVRAMGNDWWQGLSGNTLETAIDRLTAKVRTPGPRLGEGSRIASPKKQQEHRETSGPRLLGLSVATSASPRLIGGADLRPNPKLVPLLY